MTDMTDDQVRALLAHYDLPTDCDCDGDDCVKCSHYPTLQERASKQLKDAAPDLARALLQARADAKVAVAVEKAVAVAEVYSDAEVMGRITGDTEIADAISALASEDAIAEVAKLRAERDAALADVARFQEERTYVIGANDGWDAAVEQGEASPAVEKAMVRFWKKLAETHNERADRLADELTAARADAEAAVALALEEADLAVQAVSDNCETDGERLAIMAAVSAIRALAPTSGIAKLAELRAERDAAVAQNERLWAANHKLVAEQDRAQDQSDAYREAASRHRDEVQRLLLDVIPPLEADRARLAAELDAANAREAGLADLLGRGAMYVSLSMREWHTAVAAALAQPSATVIAVSAPSSKDDHIAALAQPSTEGGE